MKNEMRSEITCLFGLAVVFLSSAWKNVGMTMTCNRCIIAVVRFRDCTHQTGSRTILTKQVQGLYSPNRFRDCTHLSPS